MTLLQQPRDDNGTTIQGGTEIGSYNFTVSTTAVPITFPVDCKSVFIDVIATQAYKFLGNSTDSVWLDLIGPVPVPLNISAAANTTVCQLKLASSSITVPVIITR